VKKVKYAANDGPIIPLRTENCYIYVDKMEDETDNRVYQSPFTIDPPLNSRPDNLYVPLREFKKGKGNVYEMTGNVNLKKYLPVTYGENIKKTSICNQFKFCTADPAVRQ
jgi:hypothetical protein